MSSDWYCHTCAAKLGKIHSPPSNLTGSSEQLEKFYKHTQPTGSYGINSVFDNPSYDKYADYIVDACCSGSVEVDSRGRTNIVWLAGERTGVTIVNNKPHCVCDAVKVVLSGKAHRVHAFPTGSQVAAVQTCCECGAPIAT